MFLKLERWILLIAIAAEKKFKTQILEILQNIFKISVSVLWRIFLPVSLVLHLYIGAFGDRSVNFTQHSVAAVSENGKWYGPTLDIQQFPFVEDS